MEKAFLQISLRKEDRNVTRFLWVKNVNQRVDNNNLAIYRYTRVVFGLSPSSFLLAAVIKFHQESSNSEWAPKVLENLYADSVVLGISNKSAIYQAYSEIRKIFSEAKMNLRNFASNEQQTQQMIPKELGEKKEVISLFGLKRNIGKDSLTIELYASPSEPLSKRILERFIRRHFDPLGLLAPLLLPWKVLMQELWRKSCKWNEVIDKRTLDNRVWNQAFKNWKSRKVTIARHITGQKRQLHVFVNASAMAYAAATYLVAGDEGNREANLIYSKTRLLPLNQNLTIPKAELMAAYKVINFVNQQLSDPIRECYAWTDSKCVLG